MIALSSVPITRMNCKRCKRKPTLYFAGSIGVYTSISGLVE